MTENSESGGMPPTITVERLPNGYWRGAVFFPQLGDGDSWEDSCDLFHDETQAREWAEQTVRYFDA